jgi:hypothetical protein
MILIVCAFLGATILMRIYMTWGWHYFDMPYLDILAPLFHFDGEEAVDAYDGEVWLEFFGVFLMVLVGFHLRWSRNSNSVATPKT